MIVISGALVLVALVLLVIGLIGPSLGFVYASIGASLAAFGFLVVGILQRRKEEAVGVVGAPSSAAEIAAAIRTPETAAVSQGELATAAGSEPVGDVLIVQGRPRYHVAGCRYLTGKDASTVPVSKARAEGFSACGVCKPDEALASAAPAAAAEPAQLDEASVTVTAAPVRKTAAKTAKAPAKAGRVVKTAPSKAPAKAAKAAPAKAAKAAGAAKAAKAPAKAAKAASAAKAPAKAAKRAPAKAAKAAPAKRTATKSPAKATRSSRG